MQILDFHIISNTELKRQIEGARNDQRNINNTFMAKLFHNAEYYRKLAGSKVMPTTRRPWTIAESKKRRGDKKKESS